MERLVFGDPNLNKEIYSQPLRLSFSQIENYILCPACYFGRKRRELEKPEVGEVVQLGNFLAGVISSAHLVGKIGLKFESSQNFIRFAKFRYPKTLQNKEAEEMRDFLNNMPPKKMRTLEYILASYYNDNRFAKVIGKEKEIKGQMGNVLIWGRIDQIREAVNENGGKIIEIVEMKFNQKPNIWNSFQLGLYCYLEELTTNFDRPITGVIYNLLGRRRFFQTNTDLSLIPQIVENVSKAINLGYDEQNDSHNHLPLSKKRGGKEGIQGQFDSWPKITQSDNFILGQKHYQAAKALLNDYKNSCRWREEDLSEKKISH